MSDKPCSRENGFRVDCIKHYAEVEAENARLKADVERLTATMEKVISASDLIDERNQHLIAEVERLTAMADENAHLHKGIYSLSLNVVQLKDEVERLRKAGDELLHEWSSGDETDGRNFKKGLVLWNAAKEGKPPSV